MAFSPSDLYTEVRKIIADRSVDGAIINRAWLVTAVLSNHKRKRLDEFSICCRQLAVSAAVDKALARLKREDEGEVDPDVTSLELPRLPGHEHLRQIYPIKRDGQIFLVPIDQLTTEERDTKAATYDKASATYAEHAAELRRYRPSRRSAA